jgi:hypothetical protein
MGQLGTLEVPATVIADALNSLFPVIQAQPLSDGQILVSSVEDQPETSLTLTLPTSLGLSGTYYAQVASVQLGATDPRTLVQVGDLLEFGTVKRTVAALSDSAITLDSAMDSYVGPVKGTSELVLVYQNFIFKLLFFLKTWKNSSYTKDLTTLDRVIAPLGASPTPGQRNAALMEIEKLEGQLSSLLTVLGDSSTFLPDGAAQEERQIVNGILSTLAERNFDRAADFLLRCDFVSFMGLDADTASYGGAFLQASANFAQSALVSTGEPDPTSISTGRS